jgi:dipeptidyl aminopeptidase/acylaminoacyl peptidase
MTFRILACFLLFISIIFNCPTKAGNKKEDAAAFFAKQAHFKNLSISPDGKYIAAIVPKPYTSNLVIIERATRKPIQAFGFGHKKHIGKFHWLSNDRVLYTKSYETNESESKRSFGEIFASNIDGTKKIQLFGYTDEKSKLRNKRGLRASASILSVLPDDPEHILIKSRKWGNDSDEPTKLFKINIFNKKRKLITTTPHGNMHIVIDTKGTPIIASAKDRKGQKKKYWFKDKQWQLINDNDPINGYHPYSSSRDASVLYLTKKTGPNKTTGLYAYNRKTNEITLVFNDPNFDIDSYIREPGSGVIVGVKTMTDKINYHFLDKNNDFVKLFKRFAATFPNHDVSVAANSMEDRLYRIAIRSDRTPLDFYLYEPEKQSVNYLASAREWFTEENTLPQKFISFKARDGETIYGYLTLPKNSNKPLPLIVNVHGGPYGVQDGWHFDTETQFFANQGYAVLQVNFRGSGGYGKAYEKSAYLKRSTLIQNDIIDGTKWAMSLPNISNGKACIIGGSFGGYSAIMSPILEPELYQCSISRYGPYDLVYQMKHADYMSVDSISVGAMEKYGDNEAFWKRESALTYIDRFNIPVLIVTGGKDERVPPESAWRLKAALDEAKKSYQWLYKEKEGHGFINPDNKKELFLRSIEFLDKHLK